MTARRTAARRGQVAPPPRKRMKISNALFAEDAGTALPVHGYRSHKLALPAVPFKVNRKVAMPSASMAMDYSGAAGDVPYGGFLNQAGYNFGLFFPGYPYLAELAQRSEFRQPVATHAKDMTREWIEFKSTGTDDKSEKLEGIERRFSELGVQEVFRKALVHDGFYGLGHIFIKIDGQEDHAEKLLITPQTIRKGSLVGLINIEPMWTTPLMWNASDPTEPDFYKPPSWMVLGRETSSTRLLRIISNEVPDIIKPAFNFGGVSLSQLIEPYVDRWLKTAAGVNRLINNFSIIYLKTDMSAVLEGESNSDLMKRMKLFVKDRDNQGVFLTDKEREELSQLAVPLSGLSDLQQQALEHMAYPTHEPLVVLTGVTPSGLNASSDGEIEVYHEWNKSEQNAVLRSPIKTVLDIVQLDMYGVIDADITFGFKPIKSITGEALARIKKTEAEQDQILVDMGAIDRAEVREKVARDPDSGYTNLDIADLPELPSEEEIDSTGEGEPGSEGDEGEGE